MTRMSYRLINILAFTVGAAIGSAVTYYVAKKQYDKIINEEIESIKESFKGDGSKDSYSYFDSIQNGDSNGESFDENQMDINDFINTDNENSETVSSVDKRKIDVIEYSNLTKNYSGEKGGEDGNMSDEPYVISPYEFGENDEYYQFELTYYSDGILEDEDGSIVEDVEETIGSKALFTFGEYEDDAVFVRNDKLKADFQILKDNRTYEEARNKAGKTVKE